MSKHTDEIPSSSGGNYFRTKDMVNGQAYRLRILSDPIVGYLGWKDNKPVRRSFEEGKSGPQHFAPGEVVQDDKSKIRYFRAFAVWDYQDKAVKVFEVTQGTVIAVVRQYVNDADYGGAGKDATRFDIKLTKTGSGMDTEYAVSPAPPADLPEDAKAAWGEVCAKGFDLTELFRGGNPFEPEFSF